MLPDARKHKKTMHGARGRSPAPPAPPAPGRAADAAATAPRHPPPTTLQPQHPYAPAVAPMSARKLILVDGSAYLYRAFHALPPLSNSQRRADRRGARRAQHAEQDDQGGGAGSHRRGVRCTRAARFATTCSISTRRIAQPMPDDLRSQMQPLFDVVAAMGLPLLRVPGVEADDVIGTLAKQGAAAGYRRADLHRRQGHGAAGRARSRT